ncbi:MAG: DUF2093 domain-containing protein [Rhodobiaceae bacterium]|nr:DUF2093 domain-containing protein [Rhodobiaceae bacterium]
MNRYDRGLGPAREAKLEYLHSDFHVLSPGTFVRCAVTGQPIPLDELRYWSHERQEPYASVEIALQRHKDVNGL